MSNCYPDRQNKTCLSGTTLCRHEVHQTQPCLSTLSVWMAFWQPQWTTSTDSTALRMASLFVHCAGQLVCPLCWSAMSCCMSATVVSWSACPPCYIPSDEIRGQFLSELTHSRNTFAHVCNSFRQFLMGLPKPLNR